MKKYLALGVCGGAAAFVGYKIYKEKSFAASIKDKLKKPSLNWRPESRIEVLKSLKTQKFDILIVGGGSAGAGCALDAVTRNLKVALVERRDFAAETSSKSTKLLHGGIRYLEKAFTNLSISQFKLVTEGLRERSRIMKIAPYLTNTLPIMIPVYSWFKMPYFLAGMKVYDFIAGFKSLGGSHFLNREKTLDEFPAVKSDSLIGSVVYNDGQFDDSRLNVMLAMTAAYHGAKVANYVEVKSFLIEKGKVKGAVCKDIIRNEIFQIKAAGVINSTGPFIENLLFEKSKRSLHNNKEENEKKPFYKMLLDPMKVVLHSFGGIKDKFDTQNEKSRAKKSLEKTKHVVAPSSGTHVVLSKIYAPQRMGFVIPQTSDGRIIFFIPWKNHALVGTTDTKCRVRENPKPTGTDLSFLLGEIRNNVCIPDSVTKNSLLSAWTGIRPLVKDPAKASTESLVRNHLIHISKNNLMTLSGGKWTTYRLMAEETIDSAIKAFNLKAAGPCVSKKIKIIGSHSYSPSLPLSIARDLKIPISAAECMVSQYGDRAMKLHPYLIKTQSKKLSKLFENYQGEVEYSIDHEMALKPCDFLTRRIRMGFLNVDEARKCTNVVARIMKSKLGWSNTQYKQELTEASKYLDSFDPKLIHSDKNYP